MKKRLQKTTPRRHTDDASLPWRAMFTLTALMLVCNETLRTFDGRRFLTDSMPGQHFLRAGHITNEHPSMNSPLMRNVCPQVLPLLKDNTTMIELIRNNLESFHNGGLNLKLIEEYLNSHMESTLDRLHMEFLPRGRNQPVKEGVINHIIEAQKRLDTDKRGGYDQRRLPGRFRTVKGEVLADFRVDVLEPFTEKRWHVGLGPIADDACRSMDRIRSKSGRNFDDKFMCSYSDFINTLTKGNSTSATNQEPTSGCNILSIGGNNQWGFEETVASSTNCITHTFDCTVQQPQKPEVDSVKFYPFCVADENKEIDGRKFRNYQSLIEAAKLTSPPNLFKMDVEGYEFDVMRQMLEDAHNSGTMHLLPTQISVELHYATRMYDIPWKMRTITAAEIALFMGMMYNRGGYVPVHYDEIGPGCYSCAEILFIRMFCDK